MKKAPAFALIFLALISVRGFASEAKPDLPVNAIFKKFHLSLFQHCTQEKVSCDAFPANPPQKLKSDPTTLLQQMAEQNKAKPESETKKIQGIQQEVMREVPELTQAYQVLGQEYAEKGPKNHDEAVKWIEKNSKALSEAMKSTQNYSDQNAFSFAMLNLAMKFIYRTFHEGTVQQKDLDARFEFESAAFEVTKKLQTEKSKS